MGDDQEGEQRHAPNDDLRGVGERIEVLLEASSTGGAVQRARAEELVGLVNDLYGGGLQHLLGILDDMGRLDDELAARLADDDLVSGLLIIHGLHPYSVEDRVEAALVKVRPYLGSHGGDVELLGVGDDGVVRLRLLGSCDGCPSSSVTLQLAVEGAVEDAAPEVTGIEVETPTEQAVGGLISIESLRSRLGEQAIDGDVRWVSLPQLDDLADGEVAGFVVAELPVLACAIGANRFVYRDRCASCGSSLAGATLSGSGDRVALTCATCGAAFDVRHAGANVDGGPQHLDPLPALLTKEGWQVAVTLGPQPLHAADEVSA